MCLKVHTKSKTPPKPLTATRNITVYKKLRSDFYAYFLSRFKYERGWHYYQVPDRRTDKNGFGISSFEMEHNSWFHSIREGFHSYTSAKAAGTLPVVVKMIIPKGAKYYKGSRRGYSSREIVSNEIIFPEETLKKEVKPKKKAAKKYLARKVMR